MAEVLGWSDSVTCEAGLAPSRLSVTPGMAPVTVLDALVMAIPLTVSEASTPVAPAVKPKLPPEEETEKLPALPLVLLTIARRDPVASVTMLAVTPRLSLLMAVLRSESVLTPLPAVMVVAVPPLGVMVMVSAGRAVVALATALEAYEAVLARLLMRTAKLPVVLPAAAEAVRTLEFEEVAVTLLSGPLRLLRACMSLSRAVVSLWICFRALVWEASVDCCDVHTFSGDSAAVMEALTAEVTSMPGVDAPVAAWRIWLRSMASAELALESRVSNADSELMSFSLSFDAALNCPGRQLRIRKSNRITISAFSAATFRYGARKSGGA